MKDLGHLQIPNRVSNNKLESNVFLRQQQQQLLRKQNLARKQQDLQTKIFKQKSKKKDNDQVQKKHTIPKLVTKYNYQPRPKIRNCGCN